jgi:hypothetical protein
VNPDAVGEPCSQFPTGSKANGLHRFKQPGGDLRPRLNKRRELLGKDFASTIRIATKELTYREMKDDLPISTRDITQRPLIAAVDLR